MSSRENQGIQIALILFVIITVVLCVFTYFFYSQAESNGKKLAQAQQSNQQLTQQNNLLDSKVQHLKFFIGMSDTTRTQLEDAGLPSDEELDTMKDKYEKDRKQFGQGLPEDKQNYLGFAENLMATIRVANNGIADANQRVIAANQARDKTVVDEKKNTDTAIAAAKKAADDLQARNAAYNAARDKLKTDLDNISKEVADKSKELVTLRETTKTREDELLKEIDTEKTLSEGLKGQLANLQDESFEVADGKITWVNQRANVAWINLGSGDGLRPQTTFSVYDHNANGVSATERKGRIEVTKVIGDHQAQCRILEDELTNPILTGDKVYTPAWQPGRRLRFAMAGVLDLDGDEKSDPEAIRRIVSLNGGIVDLELKKDGSVEGEMSVETRYLILGKPPTGADGQLDENVLTTYSGVISDARKLGVDQISLEKFLNLMGWKSASQTVPLGKRLGGPAPSNYIETPQPPAGGAAPARGDDGAF